MMLFDERQGDIMNKTEKSLIIEITFNDLVRGNGYEFEMLMADAAKDTHTADFCRTQMERNYGEYRGAMEIIRAVGLLNEWDAYYREHQTSMYSCDMLRRAKDGEFTEAHLARMAKRGVGYK